jgi:hypothetical protein
VGTKLGTVELSGMESRDGGDKPGELLAFFIFGFFLSRTDPSRVPNEPRITTVVEHTYRSTLSSSQMPPDSSAMVNTSLSWVSDIPTGGIHRGIISRGFSNCDT